MVISPFILLLISVGVGYLSSNSSSNSEPEIAVISHTPAVTATKVTKTTDAFTSKSMSEATAKRKLHDNDLDGYVVISQQKSGRLTAKYTGNKKMSAATQTGLIAFLQKSQQAQNIMDSKVTARQLTTLSRQPSITQHVNNQGKSDNETYKVVAFYLLVVMAYFILLTYSTITAQEIAQDKGTKIIEIIFSSTTAQKYFFGKLLGIMGVICTQIAIYVVGGYLSFNIAKVGGDFKELINDNSHLIHMVIGNLINVNLLFVFLGVVIYTILSAFSGALVAKAEDANKAATPAIYICLAAFLLSFSFIDNPTSVVTQILSFVPFMSSFFMPIRVIDGSVSGAGIGLSLIILIVTIGAMAYYISSIYEGLMLQSDNSSFWNRFKRGLKYGNK